MTDRQNYERFLAGDMAGFEELVIKYKNGLIYFINRYIKDAFMAEDIAQDVFVDVYVHKERYNLNTSFKTYIYTIGHNKAIDYIRKNERITFVGEYEEQKTEDDELLKKVLKDEESRSIHKILRTLKPEYQAVITLIDLQDLSYKETGRILNKSNAQIKILIFRARKSLKEKLRNNGHTYVE